MASSDGSWGRQDDWAADLRIRSERDKPSPASPPTPVQPGKRGVK